MSLRTFAKGLAPGKQGEILRFHRCASIDYLYMYPGNVGVDVI